VIAAGSTSGQLVTVKIGRADNPKKRLGELQTGNHDELTLLAVLPNHGQTAETALHRKFARYKSGGGREWFKLPVGELAVLTGDLDPDDLVPHYRHVTDTGFKVELYHPDELARRAGMHGIRGSLAPGELEEIKWARANRYFRMGLGAGCAHDLYLSNCTARNWPCVPGGDHLSTWVPDPATIYKSDTDGCAPFVLDQPYSYGGRGGPEMYAEHFGLSIWRDPFGTCDNWHNSGVQPRRLWPESSTVPLEHLLMLDAPAPAQWPDYTHEVDETWRPEYVKMLEGNRHPLDFIGWFPWSGWKEPEIPPVS